MEEDFQSFDINTSVGQALLLIKSGFPVGVRSDFTASRWRGPHIQSDEEEQPPTLAVYEDGYGNAMFVFCENVIKFTRVIVVFSPEDDSLIMRRMKTSLFETIQDHIIPHRIIT